MSCGAIRRPQVDIVPVLFAQLDLEAVTVKTIAMTYCIDPGKIEAIFEAATCAGYLVEVDGGYALTRSGRNAAMTRGGARVPA